MNPQAGGYIDLDLVDAEGKPAAGVSYEVNTSDGRTLCGQLDAQGRARLQGVGNGPCQVTFPDQPSDVWSGAGEAEA